MKRSGHRRTGSSRGLSRIVGLTLVVVALGAVPGAAQQLTPEQQRAAELYQASDWEGSVEAYRGVVATHPEDGLAWIRMGRALIELSREEEALEALDRVDGTTLQTPFTAVFRARALVRLGRTDAALEVLEAIPASPALGGASILQGIEDFSALDANPRYLAVLAAFEDAAWPCRNDPMNRELDFWIGTWDVYAGGTLAGSNTIERMLGGCMLLENWTNVQGREGKSFNWVDRQTRSTPNWRQLWVADQGNTLDYYDGRFANDTMTFQGHTFGPNGDSIPQKLLFIDIHPDTVYQVFEQSNDAGESWVETWRGIYVRRVETAPEMVLGSFEDDYGGSYSITPEVWQHGSSRYEVVEWVSSESYLIARNAESNSTDAGLWTRIDWVPLEGMEPWGWAFCMTTWDAPTREAAAAAGPPDRETPRTGCGGNPFSRMRTAEAG